MGGESARGGRYGRYVQRALSTLAAVFADPGTPGAEAALDGLRARWRELAPEERESLAPVARLAAERVRAAAEGPGELAVSDDAAYLAHLAGMEAKDQWAKLEPELSKVERAADQATESSKKLLDETLKRLKAIRDSLR